MIANAIPPQDAMAVEEIGRIIDAALPEAAERHIVGKKVTPCLLEKISELTNGDSLAANIALVKNNAALAAHRWRWRWSRCHRERES